MDLVGLAAVVLIFGLPVYVVKRRYDLKERQALKGGAAGEQKQIEQLTQERKLLQERVENLETIVCGVDYELNRRLTQLAKQQSQAALPAPATAQPAEAATVPVGPAASVGLTAGVTAPAAGGRAFGNTLTSMTAGQLEEQAAAARAEVAPAELLPGGVVGKRYRVQRLLGRGGMGAVYLADDEVLGEPVALKVVSSQWGADSVEMADRFRREASAARRVSHSNVIRIHDLGEADAGLLYISMEYFPGQTLDHLMDRRGCLEESLALELLSQICDGLHAAHEAGVVHRDLKPQNVLVGERNSVKIIDFGLAKTAFLSGMTGTGLLLGTPYYMSPEQVRGRPVDARSDIYALGALSYHVLTGAPPFTGDTPIAVGFAHCSEEPVPPHERCEGISHKLSQMILAALAKDPADRPVSAAAFKRGLGRISPDV